MGKKSKLKIIRRIANQLPKIETGHVIGTPITGAELYKRGVKEVAGEPVDVHKTYREKKVEPHMLNHNRRMKKLYDQGGPDAVNGYIRAVKDFAAKNQPTEKTATNA